MLLTIVICTYKRPVLLKTCINCAIQVVENLDAEVIIINDCKEDQIIIPENPNLRLYNNPSKGLASARNLGAKMANGQFILFTDDDIEFDASSIKRLLDLNIQNPNACFNPNWKYSKEMYDVVKKTQFGRFLIHVGLVNYQGWVPELNWQAKCFETDKLAGFVFLTPKRIFELVKGFNEDFVRIGAEDDELCIRLKKLNVKMYVDPTIYVYHNETDRIGLEQRLSRYYNGAVNRKKALEMGYEHYRIHYSSSKKLTLNFLSKLKRPIIAFTKLIPNVELFDWIYFLLSHLLIAVSIFEGYHLSEKNELEK